jgi:hypothetical protein
MKNNEERYLVRCRVSRGFFDSELLVMVAGSSAYVNRENVKTTVDPPQTGEIDGFVSAYVIKTSGDKALIEIPGQAVVGGARTWVPRSALSGAPA